VRRRDLFWLAAAAPARAAEPPLRLVVAYPPGGVSDEVARALAAPLAAELGRPVRVEHRPGAGGALAMEMLARAPADGSVLVFSAVTPLTLGPLLGPTGYHPQRDIAPVAAVMATPVLVVGTPALAAPDFAGLLAAARGRPGALRWASSGLATTGHLVLEQVCLSAGVEIVHVPYKGGGQQLTDALGGQFEVLSSNVAPTTLEHVRSGRLRALAVGAAQRLPVLPAVPTLAEAGHPDANLQSLFGLFAPGATPPARVEALNRAVRAALQPLQGGLRAASNLPQDTSAADFAQRIVAEGAALQRLLKRRPIRLA
jgi:tripartite-type tricarboxylate transporter receptor subunit TctC